MQPRNVKQIIERYLSETCTDEERAWVEDWYNQQSANSSGKSFSEEGLKASALKMWPAINPTGIQVETKHETQSRKEYTFPKISKRWWAAAAILIFGIGSLLWMSRPGSTDSAEMILAGGNRATLTLADGRTIDLSHDQNGIVIGEENIKYTDGSSITSDGILTDADETLSSMLSLNTPRGGQYQITLPDGTKVWLNAATTLKYPSKFNKLERVIELDGEAYFDVSTIVGNNSKNIPFKVKTNGQTVEVLGTQFNVTAYFEEQNVKTTLVEGLVRIATKQTSSDDINLMLQPGEQATLNGLSLTKRAVDINPYIAWTKGEFIFKATPLKEVFQQLARWYDIDVDYSTIPDEKIHGIIKRDKPLSSILKTIEKTSGLKFLVTERRVILEK